MDERYLRGTQGIAGTGARIEYLGHKGGHCGRLHHACIPLIMLRVLGSGLGRVGRATCEVVPATSLTSRKLVKQLQHVGAQLGQLPVVHRCFVKPKSQMLSTIKLETFTSNNNNNNRAHVRNYPRPAGVRDTTRIWMIYMTYI
jgi:hypothetical protein